MANQNKLQTVLEILLNGRNKEADELRALVEKTEKSGANWAGFGVLAAYAAMGLGAVAYALHQDGKLLRKQLAHQENEEKAKRLAEENKTAEERFVEAVANADRASYTARNAARALQAERRAAKEREAKLDALLESVAGDNGKSHSNPSRQS